MEITKLMEPQNENPVKDPAEIEFIQRVSDIILLFDKQRLFREPEYTNKLSLLKTEFPSESAAAEFLFRYTEKQVHPIRNLFSTTQGILQNYIASSPVRIIRPEECELALQAYIKLQTHSDLLSTVQGQPLVCGSLECGERYKAALLSAGKDLRSYQLSGVTQDTQNANALPTKKGIRDHLKMVKENFETNKPVGIQEIVVRKVVESSLSNIAIKATRPEEPDKLSHAITKFNEIMAELVNNHSIRYEFRDSVFAGAENFVRKMPYDPLHKDQIDSLLRYIPNSSFDELGGTSVPTKAHKPSF